MISVSASTRHDFGGAAIDRHGDPLPAETLEACLSSDAVFLGAVGGDQWDSAPVRPEAGLLRLRKELGLFANLRPAKVLDGLQDASPLRRRYRRRTPTSLVVRELTGGIYFGERRSEAHCASDLCTYSREEIERIAHVAFRTARQRRRKVTSVDKANVLATSKLWRETVMEVALRISRRRARAHVCRCVRDGARHQSAPLRRHPHREYVRRHLSDELSVIGGSIGLLGSASIGESGPGLFEPIHGSAPEIAGRNVANPAGAIASAVMMLDQLGFERHRPNAIGRARHDLARRLPHDRSRRIRDLLGVRRAGPRAIFRSVSADRAPFAS